VAAAVRRAVAEEAMSSFDVVALQGICANYFERHVKPILSEVQESQAKLKAQVKDLKKTISQSPPNTDVVAQFEALKGDVAQRRNSLDARLEEVIHNLDLKANASEVSTEASHSAVSTDQFDLWLCEAEQKFRNSLAPLEDRQANTEKTVRSHAAKIAAWKSLDSEMESKANVRDVPTLAQFQRLSATVDKKTKAQTNLTAQFSELQAIVESKADSSCVATVSEFRDLRMTLDSLEKKTNASSASAADAQKLSDEVKLKANVADVEQMLKEKANIDQVPLTSTVENLASVMERKLAFLAARMQKTSDSVDNVLSQAMVCYVPPSPCGQWMPQPVMGRQDASGAWIPAAAPGDGLAASFAPGGWNCSSNSPTAAAGTGSASFALGGQQQPQQQQQQQQQLQQRQ